MEYYNNYPTVFMSGLGGWGEEEKQNKLIDSTDTNWYKGDGFVNLKAQSAPFGQPEADAVPGQTDFKPGIWYNMPPVNGDHTSWMDFSYQEDRVQNFRNMVERFRMLPDGETVSK